MLHLNPYIVNVVNTIIILIIRKAWLTIPVTLCFSLKKTRDNKFKVVTLDGKK